MRKLFSLVLPSRAEAEERLPWIAGAGFDGVEPTFLDGAFPSPAEYARQAAELRALCDGLGLAVPSMRAGRRPWSTIPSPDAGQRRAALEHTRLACDCLAALGGSVLLVVPGQASPEVGYDEHWGRVVAYARAAGDIAREAGLTVGLENVEARFPLSVREWRELLDEIDHPNVKMYLDVGNVVLLGLGYPEQYLRELGPRICQVHVKDAMRDRGEIRQLLEGDVDWAAVAGALRAIGYDGWIGVEPEWYRFAPHRLPARLAADLDAILSL